MQVAPAVAVRGAETRRDYYRARNLGNRFIKIALKVFRGPYYAKAFLISLTREIIYVPMRFSLSGHVAAEARIQTSCTPCAACVNVCAGGKGKSPQSSDTQTYAARKNEPEKV